MAMMARFFPFLPPRSASFRPQRRKSRSAENRPRCDAPLAATGTCGTEASHRIGFVYGVWNRPNVSLANAARRMCQRFGDACSFDLWTGDDALWRTEADIPICPEKSSMTAQSSCNSVRCESRSLVNRRRKSALYAKAIRNRRLKSCALQKTYPSTQALHRKADSLGMVSVDATALVPTTRILLFQTRSLSKPKVDSRSAGAMPDQLV